VDSVIRLRSSQVHPRAAERLWAQLTFPNPEYVKAVRFGRAPSGVPEDFTLIEAGPGDTLLLPRGAVGLVRQAVADAGQGLRFEDRRAVHDPVSFTLRLEPRDYQARAAAALARHVQACAFAPCGAGKTVIAAAAMARVGQPTLVLVRTRDLVEQWCGAIEDALGLRPGVVAEGRFAPDLVTIATVQTLAAMDDVRLGGLGRRFGCVVIDECHGAAAPTDRRVLAQLPAKYRFGLTATPDRDDGLGALLDLCIGPGVCRIEHRELIDAGHLVVPRIEAVRTGCGPAADTHGALVAALVEDEARNKLVLDLVAREVAAGRCVLVLSGRIEHCELLATLLCARGVSAAALTSRVPRARRTDLLGRFRGGELAVACATSLADEGLDVPRLDRLVLATPARAEGRTIQRLGRLMRPHPGKAAPVLYDLLDEGGLPYMQFRARCAAYKKVLGAVPAPSTTLGRLWTSPRVLARLRSDGAAESRV
jgi:superfamily II DNA or RNA helicase